MTRSKRGRRATSWIAAALLPAASTIANEHGSVVHHLQGDYGLTTVSVCLRALPHPVSEVGIDPDTRQLLLPGQRTTQSGSGIMHFSRDGRARFSGRASEIDLDELEAGSVPSIPGLTLVCNGTHGVKPGNNFTLLASCTVTSPQSGAKFAVTPVEADGFISDDGTSIELTQRANVQTIRFSLPDGSELQSERVCTQSFALVKLP